MCAGHAGLTIAQETINAGISKLFLCLGLRVESSIVLDASLFSSFPTSTRIPHSRYYCIMPGTPPNGNRTDDDFPPRASRRMNIAELRCLTHAVHMRRDHPSSINATLIKPIAKQPSSHFERDFSSLAIIRSSTINFFGDRAVMS